jgi:hypothetical protein
LHRSCRWKLQGNPPQFIRADAALVPQFAILIVTFAGLATVNVLVYALLADRLHHDTQTVDTGLDDPHRGGVLIAMGVLTADARRLMNQEFFHEGDLVSVQTASRLIVCWITKPQKAALGASSAAWPRKVLGGLACGQGRL